MNVVSKLIFFSMALLVAQAHAQNVHGILRVVKGDVQVKTSKGETTKARIGGKVFPKDIVITGKEARAKIVMVDNNEINVSPESQIEIQHYEFDPNGGKKDVLLNVIYGKVRSKVEQKYDGKTSKFQIKTPSAVAGVRGTDFMIGFDRGNQSSRVVTFEGKVEFGVPGVGGSIASAVFVTPGMTAAVSTGAAPTAPAPMPKEELAKIDNDSAAEPPKAAAPMNEPRTPAADDGSSAANSSGGGDSGRAPAAEGAAGGGASSGGGKTTCEMCAAPAAPVPPPIITSTPVPFRPPTDFGPKPPECGVACRDATKGGNTNLIIRVRGQ